MMYETRSLLIEGNLSLNDAIKTTYEKIKFLKFDDDDYKKTNEILRDLLKIKYGDELVLAIKDSMIPPKMKYLMDRDEVFLKDIQIMDKIRKDLVFIERWKAEFNPRYKQIIPYVAIQKGNQIFVTKRLKGDSRLVDSYSIGVGGHINKIDSSDDDIITTGMNRELIEELHINLDDIKEKTFKGIIYNQHNDVGKDHLGLAYSIILKDDAKISVKETDNLEGDFYTIDSNIFKEDLFGSKLNKEIYELFNFHKEDFSNIPYRFKGREFNRFYSLFSEELLKEDSQISFNKIMEIFNNARFEFQNINTFGFDQKLLFKYNSFSSKLDDLHYNLRMIALAKFENWSNAFLEKLI